MRGISDIFLMIILVSKDTTNTKRKKFYTEKKVKVMCMIRGRKFDNVDSYHKITAIDESLVRVQLDAKKNDLLKRECSSDFCLLIINYY